MSNKTEMAKRRAQMLFALTVGMAISFARADVVVRNYNSIGDDSVKAGETKTRDIHVCDSAPYYATTPFALSFAPKFEFPGESWDVVMLRLNILVGSHRAVYALDIGGLGNFAAYKMDGVGVAGGSLDFAVLGLGGEGQAGAERGSEEERGSFVHNG